MNTSWVVFQYHRSGDVSEYRCISVKYDSGVVILEHVIGDTTADLLVLSPGDGAIAATMQQSKTTEPHLKAA